MCNTLEHVLLKLKLLIVTRKCHKGRGHLKTNRGNMNIFWKCKMLGDKDEENEENGDDDIDDDDDDDDDNDDNDNDDDDNNEQEEEEEE